MNKWVHVVKTNEGFYVNGSLVGAILTLKDYDIVNIIADGISALWLQLKKK